jgi:solute carrier family 25 citrate transporter 1
MKTKMQGMDASKYNGFVDCFNKILKDQGVGGFYAGVGPRLARVILDVAITFSIFHSLKRTVTKMLYPEA